MSDNKHLDLNAPSVWFDDDVRKERADNYLNKRDESNSKEQECVDTGTTPHGAAILGLIGISLVAGIIILLCTMGIL